MWQWVCSPALGCFFPSPPLPAGVQYSSYSVELVTGFAVAGEGGGKGGWGAAGRGLGRYGLSSETMFKFLLEMKHFFAGNLNVTTKKTEVRQIQDGKVETTFDFAWTDPGTVGGVQEAMINYACGMHPLWPEDPTALIMFRVLITYKWLVHVWENKRVSIMIAFFQDVLRQNAGRAANSEEPLSYDEQESVLKNLLRSNNFRPDIPLDDYKKQNFGGNGKNSTASGSNYKKAAGSDG